MVYSGASLMPQPWQSFRFLDSTKIFGSELVQRADNFRPVFLLPFSIGQRGLEVFGGYDKGSVLG